MLASKTRLLASSRLKFSNQDFGSVCQLRQFSLASPRATRYARVINRPGTRSLHPGQASLNVNSMFLSNETNGASGTTTRTYSSESHPPDVETEFLIAGAGPAGASLACFLTSYGTFPGYAIFSDES